MTVIYTGIRYAALMQGASKFCHQAVYACMPLHMQTTPVSQKGRRKILSSKGMYSTYGTRMHMGVVERLVKKSKFSLGSQVDSFYLPPNNQPSSLFPLFS